MLPVTTLTDIVHGERAAVSLLLVLPLRGNTRNRVPEEKLLSHPRCGPQTGFSNKASTVEEMRKASTYSIKRFNEYAEHSAIRNILFVYFDYFILRRYFKEHFVLEYSEVKPAHTHVPRILHDWNSCVLTVSHTRGHMWSPLPCRENGRNRRKAHHLCLYFTLTASGRVSGQMQKVMTCFQIASPKLGIQGKTAGNPLLLSGPFSKPLHHS